MNTCFFTLNLKWKCTLIGVLLIIGQLPGFYASAESRLEIEDSVDKAPTLIVGETLSNNTTRPPSKTILQNDVPIPLTDMGTRTYFGFEGGLYPGGTNEMPPQHAGEGLARAHRIQPLNSAGRPDPNGKYILLSIGMSNTAMEFCGAKSKGNSCKPDSFVGQSAAAQTVNHSSLVIVNGAKGGQAAIKWDSPTEQNYVRIRDTVLTPLGLTEKQVQVVWLKVANSRPGHQPSLPSEQADAYRLMRLMGKIVRALKVRYPNLQQVFISSRIYGGYATKPVNPEPYAYESGFAVKWLIEAQIKQMASGGMEINPQTGDLNYDTVAPWIAWGPYLWADGRNPRSDGLVWLPQDFRPDGTHPSLLGEEKVATMLLEFYKTSPYTKSWFMANGTCP